MGVDELNFNELVMAYCALGAMAVVPIWAGAFRSLKSIGPGGKPPKNADGTSKEVEAMSAHDAQMFPFIGSAVLFSLYVAFKYFDKDLVNFLLTAYFLALGVVAVAMAFVKPAIAPLLPTSLDQDPYKFSFNFKVWDSTAAPAEVEFTKADLLSLLLSSGVGVWYATTKHWVANDIIGLAFSVEGVEMLSLGSYGIGCTLLGGLFFYDIFWVFGTEVMVSVAKSFDAPVKVVFPRQFFSDPEKMSMLGLGDIVIPGVFIALLLRYDAHRAAGAVSFSKPYFHATFLAYVSGLATTVWVMHNFEAAQPALLYLVPACVGVSFLVAVAKGDVAGLFAYSENNDEDEKKTDGDAATSPQVASASATAASTSPGGRVRSRKE